MQPGLCNRDGCKQLLAPPRLRVCDCSPLHTVQPFPVPSLHVRASAQPREDTWEQLQLLFSGVLRARAVSTDQGLWCVLSASATSAGKMWGKPYKTFQSSSGPPEPL